MRWTPDTEHPISTIWRFVRFPDKEEIEKYLPFRQCLASRRRSPSVHPICRNGDSPSILSRGCRG